MSQEEHDRDRRMRIGLLKSTVRAERECEEAKSELETLKAQLCASQQQVEQLCGDCKTIQHDYTDAHHAQLRAEAQVRELRELLVRILGALKDHMRSVPVICADEIISEVETALRSAPPSAQLGITKRDPLPEVKGVTLEELVKAHRESQKWDICRCGHYRYEHGQHVCAMCPDEASCEKFEASPTTQAPFDKTNVETASTQSGPQDSPSRSEWISVKERLPKGGFVLSWLDGAERGNAIMVAWFDVDRKRFSAPDVTHWQPLPEAPPSPAREKEKAE